MVLRLGRRYGIRVRAVPSADVDNFVLCQVKSPEFKVFVDAATVHRRGESQSGFFFSVLIQKSCMCGPMYLQA